MAKTKEEILATARAWKARNKARCVEMRAKYYSENKNSERANHLKWVEANFVKFKLLKAKCDKSFRERNKDALRDYHSRTDVKELKNYRTRVKYRENKKVRLEMLLRAAVLQSIRVVLGGGKSKAVEELIGCTTEYYIHNITRQFKPGMSWENRKSFHIDHIKPVSEFNLLDESEQKKCFHWSNTRPIEPAKNLARNRKWLKNEL